LCDYGPLLRAESGGRIELALPFRGGGGKRAFPIKLVIKNELAGGRAVSRAFRSMQWSGWFVVRELNDGGGDPAPGIRTLVIAGGSELVDARAAFLKRFVAVALHHQIGCSPDIDLGYHSEKIAGLPSRTV
jgi:hypothetical protein